MVKLPYYPVFLLHTFVSSLSFGIGKLSNKSGNYENCWNHFLFAGLVATEII